MDTLPNELVTFLMAFLDRKDNANFSVTSRRILQNTLFQTYTIMSTQSPWILSRFGRLTSDKRYSFAFAIRSQLCCRMCTCYGLANLHSAIEFHKKEKDTRGNRKCVEITYFNHGTKLDTIVRPCRVWWIELKESEA